MNACRHEAAPIPVAWESLGVALASGMRSAFPGHFNPDPIQIDEDRPQ